MTGCNTNPNSTQCPIVSSLSQTKGFVYSIFAGINTRDESCQLGDETRFGNNVSLSDSQTKEEREAKAKKTYFGNGQVVWTNGQISVAEKEEVVESTTKNDDLPF